MATSFFFNNTQFRNEQRLLQDLTDEMIKINGVDVYYVIRDRNYVDRLFTEAPTSSFNIAVPIEVYLESYEGFGGQGDFLSKFGLTVDDRLTLSVSRRRFAEDIGSPNGLIRPQEGDLIYFPFTNGVFEIKFVEHQETFYQAGALQFFSLQLEMFHYSSEIFTTGIPEIDAIQTNYSFASTNFSILTETGLGYLVTESGLPIENERWDTDVIDPITQNDEFSSEASTVVDFSVTNPFGDVI